MGEKDTAALGVAEGVSVLSVLRVEPVAEGCEGRNTCRAAGLEEAEEEIPGQVSEDGREKGAQTHMLPASHSINIAESTGDKAQKQRCVRHTVMAQAAQAPRDEPAIRQNQAITSCKEGLHT